MIETALPAVGAAAFLGASARWNWWRPVVTDGLMIPTYHKVGDYPEGSRLKALWVTAEEFRWQMEYLVRHGFTTLLFRELEEIRQGKRKMPAKPALVTFDDGYANNYEIAYPIMKEVGVKGNIFLVYETMEQHNAWHNPDTEPWVRMLTWAQVKEMQDSGVVDFGSHTMRHRNLAALPLDEVRWELFESRERLKKQLGQDIPCFAYPYGAGAYKDDVRALAQEAYPFDFAFKQGVMKWPWKPEHGPIKRLYIRGDDNRFDFHLHMTRGKSRF
ncbi:MAG: polysaccharide deacetylase family protein [Elusimicrobia bacterium]|nr:polysaccharide deacetylase family protein [Elusimicrobiota bacterium]